MDRYEVRSPSPRGGARSDTFRFAAVNAEAASLKPILHPTSVRRCSRPLAKAHRCLRLPESQSPSDAFPYFPLPTEMGSCQPLAHSRPGAIQRLLEAAQELNSDAYAGQGVPGSRAKRAPRWVGFPCYQGTPRADNRSIPRACLPHAPAVPRSGTFHAASSQNLGTFRLSSSPPHHQLRPCSGLRQPPPRDCRSHPRVCDAGAPSASL